MTPWITSRPYDPTVSTANPIARSFRILPYGTAAKPRMFDVFVTNCGGTSRVSSPAGGRDGCTHVRAEAVRDLGRRAPGRGRGANGGVGGTLAVLSADGPKLVDPAGKPVVLKGCNLGNLLILESWMFGNTLLIDGHPFKDQAALFAKMDERFGREKREALMDVYRASYVTPRDFDVIKSFGFNVVRLPFDYRALQDDAAPAELRPGAFDQLDRVLKMAEDAGVYVILDMHGVPGGQSKQDHTGQSDQKELWHDPAAQDRTVLLWKAIAERYKDRPVVAAYDLINEPYADFRENVQPELAALLPRIAEAVRSTGDHHVMYFPARSMAASPSTADPHAKGMTNIGFTEHYYPACSAASPPWKPTPACSAPNCRPRRRTSRRSRPRTTSASSTSSSPPKARTN